MYSVTGIQPGECTCTWRRSVHRTVHCAGEAALPPDTGAQVSAVLVVEVPGGPLAAAGGGGQWYKLSLTGAGAGAAGSDPGCAPAALHGSARLFFFFGLVRSGSSRGPMKPLGLSPGAVQGAGLWAGAGGEKLRTPGAALTSDGRRAKKKLFGSLFC